MIASHMSYPSALAVNDPTRIIQITAATDMIDLIPRFMPLFALLMLATSAAGSLTNLLLNSSSKSCKGFPSLLIITRTVFDKKQLRELDELSKEVNDAGKMMFVAVSINAIDSISICENPDLVATPMRRISFIKELSAIGLHPILMLRPVFPNEVIPVAECEKLIEATSNDVSCVVSSGLGVNDSILSRLGMKESDFSYKENQEYLQGAIECEIKFVNVEKELAALHKKCTSLGIPMFEHSMPAINYVMNMET